MDDLILIWPTYSMAVYGLSKVFSDGELRLKEVLVWEISVRDLGACLRLIFP